MRIPVSLRFGIALLGAGFCLAAHAAQPLVIYTAVSADKAVGMAFEKATGIPVKLVLLHTGELLARVQAERQNPQWDIVTFDGAEPMRNLAAQGLLVPFVPPRQGQGQGHVQWNALGRKLQPADHAYATVAASLAGVIVVNKKNLPRADWPHRWSDLSKPEYRGKIGMNNPAISGPTYPFVAGQMQRLGGEKAGKTWFAQLKANGLKVFKTNGVTLRALNYGVIDVALVQSTSAIGRMLSGLPFAVIYPKPVTLLPRTIGISSHASAAVRAEARQFVAFLLSRRGQALAQSGNVKGGSNFYPVVAGIAPRHGMPSLKGVDLQTVDPRAWGQRESAIDRWFTNHIVH